MPGVDLGGLWSRGRPAVMGIVNVTPDSFSDGGQFLDPGQAVERGLQLLEEGADVIDVGGESTRPGAVAVPAEIELERVVPVIAALARRTPSPLLSVDTAKAAVARAALDAGAGIVNDVSAGADPAMLPLVAAAGAAVVLMHRRGTPGTMQSDTAYEDVVADVLAYLEGRVAAARDAGVAAGRILLDPGIGFGKDAAGNLRLLRALPALGRLGHGVVVGASRKSFIGSLTGAPAAERLPGSLAVLADAASLPRLVVRVHDVAATVQFLTLLAAVRGAA